MKKKLLITVAAAIICTVTIYLTYMYKVVNNYSSKIYPGVSVENIDLSGKTLSEAKNLLLEKYEKAILQKKININVSDKKYSIDYKKLNAKYNIEQVAVQTEKYGKDLNAYQKFKLIRNPINKQFKLKFTYDPKYIDDVMRQIEKDNNKSPIDAKINKISTDNFTIIPEVKGMKVSIDELKKDIISKISGEPNGDTEVKASVKDVQADVTADMLKNINAKISTYSSNFADSIEGRCYNISLAASKINGKLLKPNEVFSFNDVIGEVSEAKGFKTATIIKENKVQEGIGGGICQVSTTLYNAILKANINSIERTHHVFPAAYVPPGMDATVNYPDVNFKFKNTLKYPIYIEGYTQDKNVIFNIYSNSSLADKSYDVVNEVYETTEPQVQYIDDAALSLGQTEEVQSPHAGCKVRVYRNTYQNGNLINHELVSEDTYKVINQIIKRGSKKSS